MAFVSNLTLSIFFFFYLPSLGNGQNPDTYICTDPTVNEIGVCECYSQFFINGDCRRSFYCTKWNPDYEEGEPYDPSRNNGCAVDCPAGQVVEFDVSVFPPVWRCVEDKGNCPGRFEYACPEEPLQLVDEECDCPSQYLVSTDCKSYRICGSETIECPEGQLAAEQKDGGSDQAVSCQDEEEVFCPGFGGFKVGCTDGDDEDDEEEEDGAGRILESALGIWVAATAASLRRLL